MLIQNSISVSQLNLDETFGINVHDHTWSNVVKNIIIYDINLDSRTSLGNKVSKQKKKKIKDAFRVLTTHFMTPRLKTLIQTSSPTMESMQYTRWVENITDESGIVAKTMFDTLYSKKIEERKDKKQSVSHMARNYTTGTMCNLVIEYKSTYLE